MLPLIRFCIKTYLPCNAGYSLTVNVNLNSAYTNCATLQNHRLVKRQGNVEHANGSTIALKQLNQRAEDKE